MADYDLAIIGGGLNGVCMARDAAGRGLRVVLIEQGDLGSGHSASMGLMQGHFTGIERGALLGISRLLAERGKWLNNAPHLVRPLQMTMPAHDDHRPPWMIRSMLQIYDRLSPRQGLPRSASLDVTHHEAGVPLKRPFGLAFAWSECVADISRLLVLAAVDAAERGATVMTGARCVRADRTDIWRLALVNRGRRTSLTARALANAAGAWIPSVAETVLRIAAPPMKLMVSSQIVLKRRFDHHGVYAFQNNDRELIYAAPWHGDFTIVGNAERPFTGDPAIVSASAEDVNHLCRATGRYFREPVEAVDVVHLQSALYPAGLRGGDGGIGTVRFDAGRKAAPLLTVFGGDATMSRRRAEMAVSRLTPFYPMSRPWTATAPLPGGDFPWDRLGDQIERAQERWPFLDARQAARLVAAYGTRLEVILGAARSRDDLGPRFGPDLTAAEARYLMTNEWARFPEDILWRRSKLGLSMSRESCEALARFMTTAAEPQPYLSSTANACVERSVFRS